MQAVRPSEDLGAVQSTAVPSFVDELPPPPAPFPVDLLQSERASVQARHDLFAIQRYSIAALSTLLTVSPYDQQLASALTELLEASYELDTFLPSPSYSELNTSTTSQALQDIDASFAALTEYLTALQSSASRRTPTGESLTAAAHIHPAINVVREELAWARVETLAHAVLEMVRGRGADQRSSNDPSSNWVSDEIAVNGTQEELPPRYSLDGNGPNGHDLPSYDHESEAAHSGWHTKGHDSKPSTSETAPPSQEKMLRELDEVTDAIERLAQLAPRLQNQRVPLRQPTSTCNGHEQGSAVRQRMEREKMMELEELWEKIERAHGKRRVGADQRADREGWEERRGAQRDHFLRDLIEQSADGRLGNQDADGPLELEDESRRLERQAFLTDIIERSRAGRLDAQDFPHSVEARLAEQRQTLIDSVVAYSSSGRLHGQDSLPPTPRTRPKDVDPREMVSMQDFIRTTPVSSAMERSGSGSSGGSRSRSNSTGALKKIAGMVRRRSLGLGLKPTTSDLSSMSYAAEHQENLGLVQVMLHGIGASIKDDWTLETSSVTCDCDEAIVTSKRDAMTLRVSLPVPVYPNQSVPLVAEDLHLEAKLSAAPSSQNQSLKNIITHALSASEVRSLRPSALCCAACDREVADVSLASREGQYEAEAEFKDLPSEHWAEMMEVWMCHQDPAFTAQLAKRTEEGFWPSRGTVLIGGSYFLIDKDQVKRTNLHFEDSKEGAWRAVTCLCGEVLGKQRIEDGKKGEGTVRFAKWAISLLRDDEPKKNGTESVRYPLPVFVVSDMLELAQAHASYRFVVLNENTDEPKLAMWLFNPSVRISYRLSASSPMPSPLRTSFTNGRDSLGSNKYKRSAVVGGHTPNGSAAGASIVRAAKIFYKVLDGTTELEKLPGFGPRAQVEFISYPSVVCSRLIASLQSSNTVYPPTRRTMGGFNIGFLQRC